MANSDLVTKKSVLDVLEKLFVKYNVGYRPDGDLECWGFSADVPQSIESLPKSYDLNQVLTNIDEGQSLNIPHQGYCINKDIVKTIVSDGWIDKPTYTHPDQLTTEIDRAIYFIQKFNFCGKCKDQNCNTCGRHNAKKEALIALDFYRHIADLFTKLDSWINEASTSEEKKCYENVKMLLHELNDHSSDISL